MSENNSDRGLELISDFTENPVISDLQTEIIPFADAGVYDYLSYIRDSPSLIPENIYLCIEFDENQGNNIPNSTNPKIVEWEHFLNSVFWWVTIDTSDKDYCGVYERIKEISTLENVIEITGLSFKKLSRVY